MRAVWTLSRSTGLVILMALSRLLDRGRERAWFYGTREVRDSRGNELRSGHYLTTPDGVRVTVAEDRQSKAELPGQVDFRVLRMHLRELAVTSSWDFVWFRGRWWEPAEPEWDSIGPSGQRHQELLLREANQTDIPGVTPPDG